MNKRKNLYKLLLGFLQSIAMEDSIFLFDDSTGKNLYGILSDLYTESTNIAKFGGNFDDGQDDNNDISNMIISLYEMVHPTFLSYCENKKKYEEEKIIQKEQSILLGKQEHVDYVKQMSEMKFDMIKFKSDFNVKSAVLPGSNKTTIRRMAQEYTSLMKDLPITWDSSVFIRANEDDTRCMKVLIIGPPETPYWNGVFIFDVHTPDGYPKCNPLMIFRNHGGKRFNPNLYGCGKVCLSLLGTWGTNQWNAETSTLMQLFISVQSLILIENPYYNEPGHESRCNNDTGKKTSADYNISCKYYTLAHTMYDLLTKPDAYPEFKDVYMTHFALKKKEIMEQCDKWASEAYDVKEIYQHTIIPKQSTIDTANKVKELLSKL
jgi:ubiquitin-protein ligase